MFSDRVIDWINTKIDFPAVKTATNTQTVKAIKDAGVVIADKYTQRYTLSPAIAELASKLSLNYKTLTAMCKKVVLPAEDLWIEWTTDSAMLGSNGEARDGADRKVRAVKIRKMGMCVRGHEKLKGEPRIYAGTIFVFCETDDKRLGFSTMFTFDIVSDNISFDRYPWFENKDVEIYLRYLVACCCIINTRRIFDHNDFDPAKLNKSRIKSGKVPLHSYTEVTMPKDTADAIRGANFGDTVKGSRGRHHVETFVRIRLGEVEIVRPHWRGKGPLKTGTALVKHKGEVNVKHEGERRVINR